MKKKGDFLFSFEQLLLESVFGLSVTKEGKFKPLINLNVCFYSIGL